MIVGVSLFIGVIFAIIEWQIPVMHWVDKNPFLNLILLNFVIIGLVIIPFFIMSKGFNCCKHQEEKYAATAFKGARDVSHFSDIIKILDHFGKRGGNKR
jgi:large-conductance mechanosensitive channel